MSPGEELAEWGRELFSALGSISVRRMFGGHGFYQEGVMFALEADGELYLKADKVSETEFRNAGGRAFSYGKKDGRTATLSYWTPPEEALESPALMASWARLALGAALRAKAANPRARREKPPKS